MFGCDINILLDFISGRTTEAGNADESRKWLVPTLQVIHCSLKNAKESLKDETWGRF